MNFNDIDLSTYGLTVLRTSKVSRMPNTRLNYVEIGDKAYDFRAYLGTREIELEVKVASDTLQSDLDSISRILNPMEGTKKLVLDVPDDRYYMAKVASKIEYELIGSKLALSTIVFICPDPLGYSTSETSSDHNINADPKTVEEETGGTGYIEPVYTLTAGELLTDVTIKVENVEGAEELQWIGTVAAGKELEIDVANWIVKNDGTVSMATVSGRFPRLIPSATNYIKVTGFSDTGSLNIKYRNTYL